MLGQEAPPQNSLRAARSVRTTAVSQSTKCVCPAAHAHAPSPALLGTHRRDPGERTSTRAIAALGPVSRAQAPSAAKARPRAAMARVAVWLTIPSGCACGRAVAGWHGRRSAHASCSDSPWLSERRAQRKASSTAHPATAPTQVCPEGVADCGSPFLCLLSFGEAKKSKSAAGPRPGLRLQPKQIINYKNNSYQRPLNKRKNPKNSTPPLVLRRIHIRPHHRAQHRAAILGHHRKHLGNIGRLGKAPVVVGFTAQPVRRDLGRLA